MENNYKNLVVDKDVYATIGPQCSFEDYDYICIPIDIGNIENSNLYEFELKPHGNTDIITFKEFINKRILKNDIQNWLYISKCINNLATMKEKYGMPCCLINTHSNDAVDIAMEHEANSVEAIQKILVKENNHVTKIQESTTSYEPIYRVG